MSGSVRTDRNGAVVDVRLDRPHQLNAFDTDTLLELREVQIQLRELAGEVRVVVFSGSGDAFCAGADIAHIDSIYRDTPRIRGFLNALRDVIVGFERLPQPVIAAVHGVALAGGIELMLGCDLVIAARSASIADHHMQRGFIPGGGSSQRLPRWLGRPIARDLLLTGRWLTAQDALEVGLVSRVVDDDELRDHIDDVASAMASRPWTALSEVKRLAGIAEALPLSDGLEEEIRTILDYYDDPRFSEGLERFLADHGRASNDAQGG